VENEGNELKLAELMGKTLTFVENTYKRLHLIGWTPYEAETIENFRNRGIKWKMISVWVSRSLLECYYIYLKSRAAAAAVRFPQISIISSPPYVSYDGHYISRSWRVEEKYLLWDLLYSYDYLSESMIRDELGFNRSIVSALYFEEMSPAYIPRKYIPWNVWEETYLIEQVQVQLESGNFLTLDFWRRVSKFLWRPYYACKVRYALIQSRSNPISSSHNVFPKSPHKSPFASIYSTLPYWLKMELIGIVH